MSAGPHSARCIEAKKQGAGWIQPEPSTPPPKCYACSSVGERTGQPLSLAKIVIPGADAVANAEGNTDGRVNASTQTARRGRSAGTRACLGRSDSFHSARMPALQATSCHFWIRAMSARGSQADAVPFVRLASHRLGPHRMNCALKNSPMATMAQVAITPIPITAAIVEIFSS